MNTVVRSSRSSVYFTRIVMRREFKMTFKKIIVLITTGFTSLYSIESIVTMNTSPCGSSLQCKYVRRSATETTKLRLRTER